MYRDHHWPTRPHFYFGLGPCIDVCSRCRDNVGSLGWSLVALLIITFTATLSKALAVSQPESKGEVGLVVDVRVSWYHVITCRTV